MQFDWDDAKNIGNYRKHGVWFEEAVSVFNDACAREMPDRNHSENEERWLILGLSSELNLLVVVFVERRDGEIIRIISARKATMVESKAYRRFSK